MRKKTFFKKKNLKIKQEKKNELTKLKNSSLVLVSIASHLSQVPTQKYLFSHIIHHCPNPTMRNYQRKTKPEIKQLLSSNMASTYNLHHVSLSFFLSFFPKTSPTVSLSNRKQQSKTTVAQEHPKTHLILIKE